MYGAVMGDISGSRYEFKPHKSKEFPFFDGDCRYTDDTVMTAACASALIKSEGGEDFPGIFVEEMKNLGRSHPDAGYGEKFYFWLMSDDTEPYGSYGNGSAMRVSPCALFAGSLEEAEELAEKSAAVTHNHPEGIKGARAVAAAIYMAKHRKSKAEIKEYIEKKYYDLDIDLDSIRDEYTFDVTCQGSVPESLVCFLDSTSYEDAVRTAISLGGDSDTMAAIAGSVAYAFYGEDNELEEQARYFLPDDILDIMDEFSVI